MTFYNRGVAVIMNSGHADAVALNSDTLRVSLLLAAYTFNNNHNNYAELTNETTATNYPANGGTLGTVTWEQDDTNDRIEMDAPDEAFAALGNGTNETITQIAVWDDTPTNNPLLAHVAVNSTLTNGGTLTLVWNAQGILNISV